MNNIIEEAKEKAIFALAKCSHKKGLYASGTKHGYTSVWSRDSGVSFLGGSLAGEKFKKVFASSLEALTKNQSERGQIPDAIGIYEPIRKSHISFESMDSNPWYIIGEYVYSLAYKDKNLLKKHEKAIEKAFLWLYYKDFSENGLPVQLPTTDWQDIIPHKYGRTIYVLSLYYAVLKFLGKNKEALRIKKLINNPKRPDSSLWDGKRNYYLPWAWKDHDGDRETDFWFDSLGNLLAIVTGLADNKKALKILNYIEKEKINRPYPVKCMYPPIKVGSKLWHSYFSTCDDHKPNEYLNGGIWPFIGGFYVVALVKAKKFKKAEEELALLAEALKLGQETEWEFNEWFHGKTGEPRGNFLQAWSAGSYLYAYECLKKKKVIFFS